MERLEAMRLGKALDAFARAGGASVVGKKDRLWQSPWVKGKAHGKAILVTSETDPGDLYLLIIEWGKPGNWYLVVLDPKSLTHPDVEVHRLDSVNGTLGWTYAPKRGDDKNDRRRKIFEKKHPECKVVMSVPSSVDDVGTFVEQITEIVRDRRRADDLVGLKGKALPPVGSAPEELEFKEGQQRRRYVLHRYREARARDAKIREVLGANHGRLPCAVCAFDFEIQYGPLGRLYAHVHHKKPLSQHPKSGGRTPLDELVVVCANCHAMIHKGGKCRRPEDVRSLLTRKRVVAGG